ncbi:MAG: NotI family restriction endonuclease [Tabrizicola sp.]
MNARNCRLPYNPETIVGEILGRRAVKGSDPSTSDYLCPFIKSRCSKRSTQITGKPYPICSLWLGKGPRTDPQKELIFVCPKRFYEVDFLAEVVKHCWIGDAPGNPTVVPEVKMAGCGNVDFVIADVGIDGEVQQFLSVELQAIDITGSVFPAYRALLSGEDLEKKPSYGFNWDNVYKRYITQLIRKGYFHHHWKSKIVAVIPEQVYDYIKKRAGFLRSTDVKSPDVNIIFMTYCLETDPENPQEYRPKLVTVEGTSHSSLQNAILYKEAPSREAFASQIKRSLSRSIRIADLLSK